MSQNHSFYQDSEVSQECTTFGELKQLYSLPLVPNHELSECTVCSTVVEKGKGIVLHDCLHNFCRDCLSNAVKNTAEPFVKCPLGEHNCDGRLEEREIKALVSSEQYQLFLLKSRNYVDVSTYNKLKELEDSGIVPNYEPLNCPICLCEVDEGHGITLHDCIHSFCRDCVISTIQHTDGPVVKCPHNDNDYSCTSFLQDREVKALVTPEMYEVYLRKSLTTAESKTKNSFHCMKPDCGGWCEFEDGVVLFKCPACDSENCITCKAIHVGQTCQQYRDLKNTNADAEKTKEHLEKMLERQEAMKCSNCGTIVQKISGCDWLVCRCQTQLCWATRGPRWGPKGTGDTSGGCQCKMGGKKCHPSCMDCH